MGLKDVAINYAKSIGIKIPKVAYVKENRKQKLYIFVADKNAPEHGVLVDKASEHCSFFCLPNAPRNALEIFYSMKVCEDGN